MTLLSGTVPPGGDESSAPSLRKRLRNILVTGFALTVPVIVTLIILQFVVNFILGAVSPVASFVNRTFGLAGDVDPLVLEVLAVATFAVLVFVVGLVAELRQGDELERVFDTAMARIPGVGSVYTSFNEMTEMLLSNETQSFQEVKLVEFPVEGSYTLAFVTADSPPEVERATDNEGMQTLFLPMAPNPVMGGHVLYVSQDRVYDVDLSVEEGIRSIVTSGVATGDSGDEPRELVDLAAVRKQALEGVDEFATQARRDFAAVHPEGDPEAVGDDGDEATHYMIERDAADEQASEAGGTNDGPTGDQAGGTNDGPTGDQAGGTNDGPTGDGTDSGGG